MPSLVTETPAAGSEAAKAHFEAMLSFETDCWDVHDAMRTGNIDFVLLDVRGPKLYEASHVPGAINLPHGKMTVSRMAEWNADTLFVVYCAGPHCNGADRAAFKLASLGLPVKIMIGGISGWQDEELPFASGREPGALQA